MMAPRDGRAHAGAEQEGAINVSVVAQFRASPGGQAGDLADAAAFAIRQARPPQRDD